ncbi:MAG: hypothetical protein VX875_09830 [Pseudomonadota bacterium]|nr:hypothetical protein [Pseudomonadota bacterium]
MLVTMNHAQFVGAPVFGGILYHENLLLGIRSDRIGNFVNLSDRVDRAKILDFNGVEFIGNQGIKGNQTNFVQTDIDTKTLDSFSISTTFSAEDLLIDNLQRVVLIGNAQATPSISGVNLMYTSEDREGENAHIIRFLVYVKNSAGNSASQFIDLILPHSQIAKSELITVNVAFDATQKKMTASIPQYNLSNTLSLTAYQTTGLQRPFADTKLKLFSSPNFVQGASATIREILLWNKALSPTEFAQQNEMSQKWMTAI